MEKITTIAKRNDKVSKILCDSGFSWNTVSKLFREKDVRLNGEKLSNDADAKIGDEIVVFTKSPPSRKFEIVFEDDNVCILNKKNGIEVEGEDGLEGKTGFIAVHRIDRNTEGLVVMAKNKKSEEALLFAFKNGLVEKTYLCEVVGKTNYKEKLVSLYLKKDSKNSLVKVFQNEIPGSSLSKTVFTTLQNKSETSIVSARLLTGKTHQIRSTLAYLSHPILGDGKYGKNSDNIHFHEKTQKLFSSEMKFNTLPSPLGYLSSKSFSAFPVWFKK